jgi:hypothetical protein
VTEFWVTHPWLTIGGITTGLAGYSYMFFNDRRRRALAVKLQPPAIPKSSGEALSDAGAWQRAVRGGAVTALFPGGFSVLMLLMWLFGGRYQRDHGVTIDLLQASILYFIGSTFLGAAIGLGLPYMRGLVRSTLIGAIAIAPLFIGSLVSMDAGHWGTFETVFSTSMSVLMGMAIGVGVTNGKRRAGEARDGSTLRP